MRATLYQTRDVHGDAALFSTVLRAVAQHPGDVRLRVATVSLAGVEVVFWLRCCGSRMLRREIAPMFAARMRFYRPADALPTERAQEWARALDGLRLTVRDTEAYRRAGGPPCACTMFAGRPEAMTQVRVQPSDEDHPCYACTGTTEDAMDVIASLEARLCPMHDAILSAQTRELATSNA